MRVQYAVLLVAVAGVSMTGCSKAQGSQGVAAPSAARPAQASPAQSAAPPPVPVAVAGPDILTTTSGADAKTPTDVSARFAHFQIAPVDGADTLLVDGKPAAYSDGGQAPPQPIAANVALTLLGVFELQNESVAWVEIGGGTACAGAHILVAVGPTHAVRAYPLNGCDDRGTMRKVGDSIVFDAGGKSGTYEHGRITGDQ